MPEDKTEADETAVAEVADDTPDETIAGRSHGAGGAETELLPPSQPQAVAAAWSETDDSPELVDRQPWRKVLVIALAILVPLAIVATIIGVSDWLTGSSPAPSVVPTAGAPAPTILDGTFKVERYPAQGVIHANAQPAPIDPKVITTWWAFRSTCIAGTCVAHGVKLDNDDHSLLSDTADDLVFKDGLWRDAQPLQATNPCADGKSEASIEAWNWGPVVSGTSHGT